MNPGKLKDEIVIQQPTVIVQDNGQTLSTWATYATLLADVTTYSVKQWLNASKEIKQGNDPRTLRQNKWLVMVRHDPDVSSAMRVRWLDHTLTVEGITADPKNAVYMYLHCLETTPAGQGFGDLSASANIVVTIASSDYEDGDTYAAPNVNVGATGSITVLLDNTAGTAVLAVAVSVANGGSDVVFSSDDTDKAIAAEGSDTITVDIDGTVTGGAGDYTGTLTLQTNDPDAGSIAITLTVTLVNP